ncbi:DUF362 domain-containing protein [Candidatus Thorarchaeota archaeon]|nr:MAG: DUF362 domain-containing protein [Candidatus Thorarchaeota archaeon]
MCEETRYLQEEDVSLRRGISLNATVAAVNIRRHRQNAVKYACDLIGGIDDIDVSDREVVIKVGVFYPEIGWYSTVETVDGIIRCFSHAVKKYLVETDNYQGTGTDRLKVWESLFSDTVVPVNLSDEEDTVPVKVPNLIKEVTIDLAKLVLKPRVFVDTHVMRGYERGSILKNLFGLPPTRKKVQYHKNEIFFNLLTSLYEAIGGVDLAILDATYFTQFFKGKGARARTDFLFVGRDAVAVEAVGLHLAGIKPHKAQVIQSFTEKGLGIGDLDKIDIVGVPMDKLELKFGEAGKSLEAEIASKPDSWAASKAINDLIRSGYFKLPNKRTMSEVIKALKEADSRAKNRDKMIYTVLKRRFDKGKLMGEKTDTGWIFWTT